MVKGLWRRPTRVPESQPRQRKHLRLWLLLRDAFFLAPLLKRLWPSES